MSLNPFTLIDTILSDYASPKTRRAIHSLLLLVAVLVTVWLTAEGNWKEAVLALVAAIYAGANQANTPATDLDAAGDDSETDDGLSYEESGGRPYEPVADDQYPGDTRGSDPLRW